MPIPLPGDRRGSTRRAGTHPSPTFDHTYMQERVAGSIGELHESESLLGIVPFDDGLDRETGGASKL